MSVLSLTHSEVTTVLESSSTGMLNPESYFGNSPFGEALNIGAYILEFICLAPTVTRLSE